MYESAHTALTNKWEKGKEIAEEERGADDALRRENLTFKRRERGDLV